MSPLFPRLCSLLLASAAAAPLAAQCKDPAAPSFGFPLTEQNDQVLLFKDGTKTKVDVRFPAGVSPSSCGWPVIVFVHGLSGTRKDLVGQCRRYASLGYLTAAYEVRGQSEWKTLNPTGIGAAFVGMEERLDLAEVIRWIGTTYASAPKADLTRVGVTGPSQGGLHAWAAAAWSGKSLPANSRSLTSFPVVKAAVPKIFPAMHESVFVPGGNTFLNNLVLLLYYTGSVRYDPGFQTTLQGLVGSESYSGTAAFFSSDPWRQDRAQLASSTVAICATVGWTDSWADAQPTLDALAALPAGTPRLLLLDASIGHGLFPNDRQSRFATQREDRWLARFLKGDQNGIDAEARIATSLPLTDSRYDADPTTLLWNRSYDAWPPANNLSSRLWLRAGQSLAASAPAGAEPGDGPVLNPLGAGYGMAAYITHAGTRVSDLLALTPPPLKLSSLAYDGAALADDLEVAGRPQVTLEVTTTDRTLMLHCALFDVPPGGAERYVTGGTTAIRGAAGPVQQVQVTMSPIQMRFPKGHKLRLRVENLPWRRTTQRDELEVVPCFSAFSVAVEHSATRPSFLDLPVRGSVMPALSSPTDPDVFLAVPRDLRLVISTPDALRGSSTLTLFTTSGTALAFMLLGSDPIRFTPDPLTSALANAGPPLLYGQGDVVQGNGEAYSLFGLSTLAPLSPAFTGLRVSAAALVVAHGYAYPTNSIDFILR